MAAGVILGALVILIGSGPREQAAGAAGPTDTPAGALASSSTAQPVATENPEPTKPFVSPEPTAASTPVSLRLCGASDVKISLVGWGAAMGTMYTQLELNPTGSPCALAATPGVALDNAGGAALVSLPAAQPAPNDLVGLTSGLRLRIGWDSWCGGPPEAPLAFVVDFGNGLVLRQAMPADFLASCQGSATSIFADPMYAP